MEEETERRQRDISILQNESRDAIERHKKVVRQSNDGIV